MLGFSKLCYVTMFQKIRQLVQLVRYDCIVGIIKYHETNIQFAQHISGSWFQTFFIFTPKIGEDEPILSHIFQMERPTRYQFA